MKTMHKLIVILTFVFAFTGATLPALAAATNNDTTTTTTVEQSATATPQSDSTTTHEEPSTIQKIISGFISLVFLIVSLTLMLGPIAHMAYVNYKLKKLKTPKSAADFAAERAKLGKAAASTDAENQQSARLLADAFEQYSIVEPVEPAPGQAQTGDEQILRKPAKMKELIAAQKLLEQVIAIAPTDEGVLEEYNRQREFLYSQLARSFYGSTRMLVVCILVFAAFGFLPAMTGGWGFWTGLAVFLGFGGVPVAMYYMGSLTPQFMIDRKKLNPGTWGKVFVGIAAVAFGSGYTIRTRYSDGSTSDDHSGHWIALFLGVMVLCAIAASLIIWGFFSYIRNYVIHW